MLHLGRLLRPPPWIPHRVASSFFPLSSPVSYHYSTTISSTGDVPERARAVVIGGGVVGCSVAYHLTKEQDWGARGDGVVLLEQDQVTSGTTWHAAGLMVTFGSLSETSTKMRQYSKSLYQSLEEETGLSTGFMPVGFIEVAGNKDRLEEYRRVAAFNRAHGVDVHEISPKEVQRLFPLARVDDIEAGFYVPDDGRVNPVDVTMALAKGARMHGARIIEKAKVVEILEEEQVGGGGERRVRGVRLADGRTIECEVVVNACGAWAPEVARGSGVALANQAAEHYYMLTDTIPEVNANWPVIEDPSCYTYIRPEGGGLLVGLFEGEAAPWQADGMPEHFNFGEIEPDWERITPYLERAMTRVPIVETAGIKKLFCGPESFTPDLAPQLGEAPELRNYFVAAGLNSIGILSGGGIGQLMARWVATGDPGADVTAMNVDRVHGFQATRAFRGSRVRESLGNVYKCHYPNKVPLSARLIKRSPLHSSFAAKGAHFTVTSGWESPEWFAESAEAYKERADEYRHLGWGRAAWYSHWQDEHAAVRDTAGLIDMSFMSKFTVQGAGAGALLDQLSTAKVDGTSGKIVYTQWLNEHGLLEADLTVIKRNHENFLVVATDTAHRHVETWLRRHAARLAPASVHISDVSGSLAQINVQGPRSRQILEQILRNNQTFETSSSPPPSSTTANTQPGSPSWLVSDEALPFLGAREMEIGCAPALVVRITYVGEMGYEIYVPTETAVHAYERIVEAGEPLGLKHCGLKALSSLRMEKAYRDYGHDMDNTDSLLECGLGFTVDWDKVGGFIGQEAVKQQKEQPGGLSALPQRLCQVLLTDPEPLLYHGEVVLRDGNVVGDIRAASYGYSLQGAVGLAMIRSTPDVRFTQKCYLDQGRWEVQVGNNLYPAKLSLRPMFDPKNERIK